MPRYVPAVAFAALLALTITCGPNRPASDRRHADIQAVKDVEAAWVKDFAAKDADKLVNYYSDDGSVLLPNMPIITGKENNRTELTQILADPNFSLNFRSTFQDASKGGDFVYVLGTYTMTMSSPKDKSAITDHGKYLTVYKKQADGSWKAVADMISSDLPVSSGGPQKKAEKKSQKKARPHGARRRRSTR